MAPMPTATRSHRSTVDYRTHAGMERQRRKQQDRRGSPATHPYVVGRWLYHPGTDRVLLAAIVADPASLMPAAPLVCDVAQRRWYRWRTRQGAHQWLRLRPTLSHLQVVNLDSLDATAEL